MNSNQQSVRLVLYLTPGTSLHTWHKAGMFDREVAIYKSLQERGANVSFVSFGGPEELQYSDRIPDINILCNRWKLPSHWYARLVPVLHGWHLARADVLKTNQTKGAEIALRSSRVWRKPLIARCGFMRSDFAAQEHGRDSRTAIVAAVFEEKLFKAARRVVVTTEAMQRDIANRVPEAASHTVIISNYVDTKLFIPQTEPANGRHIVFVGRAEPQNNLQTLLEAIQTLDVTLTIIGSGSLKEGLQTRFSALGDRVKWEGNVPNRDLPEYLRRASIFVLPSHCEGHPKALLEAMSCGVPVLAANSPGIRELIQHGGNGWLCETDAASIRTGIVELLDQPDAQARLGKSGRDFIEANFSLDRVVELEFALLSELVA